MMIDINLLIKSLICLNLSVFLLTSQTLAFMSLASKTKTHQDITRDAILQTTVNICISQKAKDGKKFVLPDPLTIASLAAACFSTNSTKDFQSSINEINKYNALVDVQYPNTPSYHFHNEEFWPGHDLITTGVSAVINNVKQQKYQAAREALGKTLHTLQDFYSHSNWIELGNTEPYADLIKSDTLISTMAVSETCSSCNGDGCPGNILETVISQQKLTSGYYGLSKPNGKCSHGGDADISSWGQGGINKDTPTSSHGYLHKEAASVATNASAELLDDIRVAVGDSEFLRLVGLGQTSSLCFVIDTTSSMTDDIAVLRKVTSSIIKSKKGNAIQPLEYILVTFNDTNAGILRRTSDPKVFKDEINAIIPEGGGDDSEMCLTGLQVALKGSPPNTEIFVFTDADAKDPWLTCTIRALIERTKSIVTFVLTRTISNYPIDYQEQVTPQPFDTQLYQDLALASGGRVFNITNITQASNITAVTSNTTLVTLFQAKRNSAKVETFQVNVDFSVQNLTILIAGDSLDYIIISPTGVLQDSTVNTTVWPVQTDGNLNTVQPNELEPAGRWYIRILNKDKNSTNPYSIQVVGLTEIDILFDFIELSQGLHLSYSVLNTRHIANTNTTLLLSMLGGDNMRPTKVSLAKASSSETLPGTLEEIGSGQYLVSFTSPPAGNFTVRVDGMASFLSNVELPFQRQSAVWFQISNVNISTQPNGPMEPGNPYTLPFTVATSGSGGSFIIRVSNDQNFNSTFNTSTAFNNSGESFNLSVSSDHTINKTITLNNGSSVNETVTLFVTNKTSFGTEVTVTIQAEAADRSDFNYVVLRLLVAPQVPDFVPVTCEIVTTNDECPSDCRLSAWNLIAEVHSGYGLSLPNIKVLQGNGAIINTTVLSDMGKIITTAVYNASCCDQQLELVAVDEMGNTATCFRSLRSAAAPSILTYGVEFFLIFPVCLWLNMEVLLHQFMQL